MGSLSRKLKRMTTYCYVAGDDAKGTLKQKLVETFEELPKTEKGLAIFEFIHSFFLKYIFAFFRPNDMTTRTEFDRIRGYFMRAVYILLENKETFKGKCLFDWYPCWVDSAGLEYNFRCRDILQIIRKQMAADFIKFYGNELPE